MMTLTDKVKRIIQKHVGRRNAITVRDIAARLKIPNRDLTNLRSRIIIRNLIRNGVPIGSCGRGYFIIESEEELQIYIADLNRRVKGILRRKKDIKKAYYAKKDS